MYDHFVSVGTDKLMKKIRHMNIAEGCDTIVLDHISIAVSGIESDEGERKMLDVFMTDLRSFVEETGCTVHAIVHLKRVTGKNFNEGASVSLTDLRGSASLEQLSDAVISAERNQQGDNPFRCTLRVLKCRETGETGQADNIRYIKDTGIYIIDTTVDEDSEYQAPDRKERKF
ncbi:MAG: DnaB-like helicase C-terminal domain-containing protein [Paraclostridium sp.]